ncbi:hypothetical protein FAM18175_02048 [Lacticaseibacillus paracasei]|nr:hypothetical protein FAM18175_02048 [Lacticaseibacillus paracasei]
MSLFYLTNLLHLNCKSVIQKRVFLPHHYVTCRLGHHSQFVIDNPLAFRDTSAKAEQS